MKHEQIVKKLSELPYYQKFNTQALFDLLESGEVIEYKKGVEVVREGNPSDKIYILISGILSAMMNYQSQNEISLGKVYEGELFGEMGFIQRVKRACSIVALCDSVVLGFDEDAYNKHINSSIVFSALVNQTLINRLRGVIQKVGGFEANKVAYIAPFNSDIDYKQFFNQLRSCFDKSAINYLLVSEDEVNQRFGKEMNELKFQNWIKELHSEYDCILFMPCKTPSLYNFYATNIDRLILVIEQGVNKKFSPQEEYLWDRCFKYFKRKELVILRDKGKAIKDTALLLEQHVFDNFYHCEKDSYSDLQRIMRFIIGQAIGLVCGAGGTRGWVHLGAIKAMNELDIPIDYIGGTSIGSIASSMYAFYGGYERMYEATSVFKDSGLKLKEITWPRTSLISGKNFTSILRKMFHDSKLEDLALNLFLVAYNMSSNHQVIFKQWPIWQAVRASCSLPAIFPPVAVNGEILVDGAVYNALPTDVIRDEMRGLGKVIAVDLSLTRTKPANFNFPPVLTLTNVLKNQYIKRAYKLPSIIGIAMRAMMIGSSVKKRQNSELADVLIQPSLVGTKLLSENNKDELIEIGYRESMEKLSQWKF